MKSGNEATAETNKQIELTTVPLGMCRNSLLPSTNKLHLDRFEKKSQTAPPTRLEAGAEITYLANHVEIRVDHGLASSVSAHSAQRYEKVREE